VTAIIARATLDRDAVSCMCAHALCVLPPTTSCMYILSYILWLHIALATMQTKWLDAHTQEESCNNARLQRVYRPTCTSRVYYFCFLRNTHTCIPIRRLFVALTRAANQNPFTCATDLKENERLEKKKKPSPFCYCCATVKSSVIVSSCIINMHTSVCVSMCVSSLLSETIFVLWLLACFDCGARIIESKHWRRWKAGVQGKWMGVHAHADGSFHDFIWLYGL
jgi:hypothetical protein